MSVPFWRLGVAKKELERAPWPFQLNVKEVMVWGWEFVASQQDENGEEMGNQRSKFFPAVQL